MKVVCIDNKIGNSRHLELGKVYHASEANYSGRVRVGYLIVKTDPWCEANQKVKRLGQLKDIWVEKRCLITIELWRDQQLDKIL